MTDLVERHRNPEKFSGDPDFYPKEVARLKAALEAAQAQAAEVRRETVEALKPFAEYMEGGLDRDHHGDLLPGDHGVGWVYLTHADFRRAAAAIRALTDAAKGDQT